ncbi:MAG TPA: restriction endonuclease [Kofleriaceae bacterium]|nr:restriction endonuclease [Kofleriaceae bacterium]
MAKKQSASVGGGDGAGKRKKPPAKKPPARKADKDKEKKAGARSDRTEKADRTEKKPAAKKPARRKTAEAQQRLPVDVVAEAPARREAEEREERLDREELAPVPGAEAVEDTEGREDLEDAPLVREAEDEDEDEDIEDAEILGETRAEATQETAPVSATDADDEDTESSEPELVLSEEERALRELYGDIAAPATAHTEFQDRQTADEDRPMVPEINARDERKQRWEERRDRRRQRREERGRGRPDRPDRPDRQDRPAHARPPEGRPAQPPRESQPQLPRPVMATPPPAPATCGHDHDALARVGTPLGDAAATVFAQLRNGQPLPVRQLAAMMRKRSLVEVDPEQLAPQLKAELLGDERSYRTLGLRPRIVYRGRDLFAPGPVAMSATADAEAGFAAALSRLAGATHRALAQRIAKASPAGFERLIHAYLVAAGYRDISWVKRIGGISYASAVAPGIDRVVLLSARSGDQPIDRRGIGELRVGVEAKNLVAGFLFSARELSEDAERELERAGRSIAVICGDQLVATLIAAGVGVVSAAAPLHYVDDQLLDELLAG